MAIHLIICAALCEDDRVDHPVTSVYCSTRDYWEYEQWQFEYVHWSNFLCTSIGERNIYRRGYPGAVPFGAILSEHYSSSFACGLYTEVLLFRDDSVGEHRGLCDAYIRHPLFVEKPDRFMEWHHYALRVPIWRWWEIYDGDIFGAISLWPSMSECPAPPWLSWRFDRCVAASMRYLGYSEAEVASYYLLRRELYRHG